MTWWQRLKRWLCWWMPPELIHTDAWLCACDACVEALLTQADGLLLQLDLLASLQGLSVRPHQAGAVAGEVPGLPVIPRATWQGLASQERRLILAKCAITIEAQEVMKDAS